jgi:hypothetical protein
MKQGMILTEFLLARIAEDEEPARMAAEGWVSGDGMLEMGCWDEKRVLAECEAKRRIVKMAEGQDSYPTAVILNALALPYADHPDLDRTNEFASAIENGAMSKPSVILNDREVRHEYERLRKIVATEPDRTRAAVVKALRDMASVKQGADVQGVESVPVPWVTERADEIENGADW